MALPASGAISFSQVNTELGLSATATISLNDTAVRNLFGRGSGAISMSDGHGKGAEFAFTISANQSAANLRTLAVNAGWDQSSKVIATIASGVSFTSTSTATPALTVNGTFPGGVTLINNGTIAGRGGAGSGARRQYAGGTCTADYFDGGVGGSGGTALLASVPMSLDNKGTIGGGGGGGGSGRPWFQSVPPSTCGNAGSGLAFQASGCGGGGAGLGTGGAHNRLRADQAAVTDCVCCAPGNQRSGSAGGGGALTAGGTAGARAASVATHCIASTDSADNGGAGGAMGAEGSAGVARSGNSGSITAGGAGGAAISGSANITYIATGTRLGAVT